MGVTNSSKQINVDRIDCNGTLKVTLGLAAAPDISSKIESRTTCMLPSFGKRKDCPHRCGGQPFLFSIFMLGKGKGKGWQENRTFFVTKGRLFVTGKGFLILEKSM